MTKVVILTLYGNVECENVTATVTIGLENSLPIVDKKGTLPCNPTLVNSWQEFSETYRNQGQSYVDFRIKPKSIKLIKNWVNECNRIAQKTFQQMQEWLASDSFRPITDRIREELNRADTVRFIIRTEDPTLQNLPWHSWELFERYPHAEFSLASLDAETPPPIAVKPTGKVQILAIFGDDQGININSDRELLTNLKNAGASVHFLVKPKRSDINDELWEKPWQIIFFAGHSESNNETGKIYINDHESLTITDLWYGLKKARDNGLQLAIFNSCDGLGIAHQLDDLQIPQMVIMRELVPDLVAQQFLINFLGAFSQGQSLYLAVREAREKLQGLEDQYPCATWLPAIYQNCRYIPPTWQDLQGENSIEIPPISPIRGKEKQRRKLLIKSLVGGTLCYLGWTFVAPKLSIYISNYAFDLFQQRRSKEAQKYWQLAHLIDPHNPVPIYQLGWVTEKAGNSNSAEKKYQIACELGFISGCHQLSRLYILDGGNYEKAEKLSRECLNFAKETRDESNCHKNLGWAQLKAGNLTGAERSLIKAIDFYPKKAAAHCLLGFVKDQLGDKTGAITSFTNCKNLAHPSNADEAEWSEKAEEKLEQYAQLNLN